MFSPRMPPQPPTSIASEAAKAGIVSKLKKYIGGTAGMPIPLPPVSILSQTNHTSFMPPLTPGDPYNTTGGKENKQQQTHAASSSAATTTPSTPSITFSSSPHTAATSATTTAASSTSMPTMHGMTGALASSLSSAVQLPRPPVASGALSLSSFDIGKKLGSGKYGHVYLARDRASGFIVALKQISLRQLDDDGMHHQLLREIEIQAHIRHVNVLRLFQFFVQERHIYLVLEFAPRGQLYDHLLAEKHFSEKKTAHFIGDLATAFHFCHSKHVIHRDIKPENLLLGFNNIVKIADFGWSVHAPRDRRQTMCGTLDYLSPEMVLNATGQRVHYDHTVDIWCLGVLMYEFLYGSPPFFVADSEDPTPTYDRIKGVDLHFPDSVPVSDDAKDLMRRMIVREPRDRIALIDVVQHRWITKWTGGEEVARKRVERMRRWDRNGRREGSLFNGNVPLISTGGAGGMGAAISPSALMLPVLPGGGAYGPGTPVGKSMKTDRL